MVILFYDFDIFLLIILIREIFSVDLNIILMFVECYVNLFSDCLFNLIVEIIVDNLIGCVGSVCM